MHSILFNLEVCRFLARVSTALRCLVNTSLLQQAVAENIEYASRSIQCGSISTSVVNLSRAILIHLRGLLISINKCLCRKWCRERIGIQCEQKTTGAWLTQFAELGDEILRFDYSGFATELNNCRSIHKLPWPKPHPVSISALNLRVFTYEIVYGHQQMFGWFAWLAISSYSILWHSAAVHNDGAKMHLLLQLQRLKLCG